MWDGEGAVGRWRARQPELTGDCQAFRGVLGTKVYICKPADREAKGMLERLHDYLEKSFLPGRTFTSPEDFNTQLAEFFVRANARRMRVLGCTPGDRVAADRAAMMALPPVPPQGPREGRHQDQLGPVRTLGRVLEVRSQVLRATTGDTPPCGDEALTAILVAAPDAFAPAAGGAGD